MSKPHIQDFSIKLLDDIIQVEEDMYGFSLYSRGNELKTSLFDVNKIKDFIKNKQSRDSEPDSAKRA